MFSKIYAEVPNKILILAGLGIAGVNPEGNDVGPGRTALAAVASEPAAVDAVFSAPARSRLVSDAHAPSNHLFPQKGNVHLQAASTPTHWSNSC